MARAAVTGGLVSITAVTVMGWVVATAATVTATSWVTAAVVAALRAVSLVLGTYSSVGTFTVCALPRKVPNKCRMEQVVRLIMGLSEREGRRGGA